MPITKGDYLKIYVCGTCYQVDMLCVFEFNKHNKNRQFFNDETSSFHQTITAIFDHYIIINHIKIKGIQKNKTYFFINCI